MPFYLPSSGGKKSGPGQFGFGQFGQNDITRTLTRIAIRTNSHDRTRTRMSECPNLCHFSCCFFPVVLPILVTEWPNVRMTEFIYSPNFVRQKNRVRTFVRMSEFVRTRISPKIRTTRTRIYKPEPDPIFHSDTSECPNLIFGQKNDDQIRFLWVGQIQIFESGNFLSALVKRTGGIIAALVTWHD